MARTVAPRRTPQGPQGERRVALILDTAARLFAEHGYEATTTNAIAARAGVSVGSLYQYFPDKESVAQELARRYRDDLRALYDRVLAPDPAVAHLPLAVLLDRLIDPLADFSARHAGFEALFCGPQSPVKTPVAAAAMHDEVVHRVEVLFTARAPTVDPARRRLCATMSVGVVEAFLPLASASDPARRADTLAEIKRLLQAYLAPVVGD